METKINYLSNSENEVEVSYTAEEIKPLVDAEVSKKVKTIQIDGFRKGKAPISAIKKIYGDSLEYDAVEKITNRIFWDVVKEKELKPIGEPVLTDVNYKPGEPLHFKVKYEVMPDIELKNYKGIEIDVPDIVTTEEEIDVEIYNFLYSKATHEQAEIIDGDKYSVTMDIEMLDDKGEPVENSVQRDVRVHLGNKRVYKELIDKSQNKKVGDKFSYSYSHKAKHEGDAEEHEHSHSYTATIKNIEKTVMPELTEEMIKSISGDKASNENELREHFRKLYQRHYDDEINKIFDRKMEEKIVELNPISVPRVMVNNYLEELVKERIKYLKEKKVKNVDVENIRKNLTPSAEFGVKWFLLKDAIITMENITVTDEAIQEIAKERAEYYEMSYDTMYKHLTVNEEAKNQLLGELFWKFIVKNNVMKKVPVTEYYEKIKKEETNEK